MIPGEFILKEEEIVINSGKAVKEIAVTNIGDRPIQVGSHFHFFEVNRFLTFDREEAYGYRLDIASGTAIRFEPNETKTVQLVEIGGKKRIKGLNHLTDAQINDTTKAEAVFRAKQSAFMSK